DPTHRPYDPSLFAPPSRTPSYYFENYDIPGASVPMNDYSQRLAPPALYPAPPPPIENHHDSRVSTRLRIAGEYLSLTEWLCRLTGPISNPIQNLIQGRPLLSMFNLGLHCDSPLSEGPMLDLSR